MKDVMALRILILATPVAPLGAGSTGGVTLQIETMAKALHMSGHSLDIIALEGSPSVDHAQLLPIDGSAQPSLASVPLEGVYPIPPDAVIGHFWRAAYDHQNRYDIIINTAHDWLPYYVSPFFTTPVAHMVNMGDVNAATTAIIRTHAKDRPQQVAFLSQAQARIFTENKDAPILPLGLDLADYGFQANAEGGLVSGGLVWAGRISPEKGLEDALEIARRMNEPLTIAGGIDNAPYWQDLQAHYQDHIDYRGLLDRHDLQACLGAGRVLLQTQKWQEAFGLVTIEAQACGTPVIAYDRGANAELIDHGETGYITSPDDIDEIIRVLPNISDIDRRACRKAAEERYDLPAFAKRLEGWLETVLTDTASP